MSSQPQWSPVDDETADLLALVAAGPLAGNDAEERFLRACEVDAALHGFVSVNRVRAALSNEHGLTIEPHQFSALWSANTGRGKAMVKAEGDDAWEICKGSPSGNDGKPYRKRKWVGIA